MATRIKVRGEYKEQSTGVMDRSPAVLPFDEQEIRVRAYQKYCDRNGAPGDALMDWLQAETELRELSQRHSTWTPTQRERALLSARESDTSGDPIC